MLHFLSAINLSEGQKHVEQDQFGWVGVATGERRRGCMKFKYIAAQESRGYRLNPNQNRHKTVCHFVSNRESERVSECSFILHCRTTDAEPFSFQNLSVGLGCIRSIQ